MSKLTKRFPELKPFESDLNLREKRFKETYERLAGKYGKLSNFANGHHYYGIHKTSTGWIYREWAPGADQLYLAGDFNNWNWTANPLKKIGNGNWEIEFPDYMLTNGSRVITIVKNGDSLTQHLPLYTKRAVQNHVTKSWHCEVLDNQDSYPWEDEGFYLDEAPIIYEAHVGMSSEEERENSYIEFADNILPHIKDNGYNTIQLMGIMEHPYYGSFGYQVSNFFAPSFRYGYPDELKYLINKAHKMGIRVLLDIVHSHAVGNSLEGINLFDGTSYQFFHEGSKGDHPSWGTKCFNYGKDEVIHYLLSNCKFWMEEYHFDGFRFDGVTSMLYWNRGMDSFTSLNMYFSLNTDVDAVTYLQLANALIKEINPHALTIAEDMSGMPGMCEPISDGGIGFNYRLGMGLPDMWTKLAKDTKDEDWNMGFMWGRLVDRNANTIAYVESHDQALVGDKTFIFTLADAEMYTGMEKSYHSYSMDRATALHKLARLLTLAAGGTGYLAFMGNEFGHPEWIDFPRVGNNWSYKYCRRQWSLLYNPLLKFEYLNEFDKDMINLIKSKKILNETLPKLMRIHEDDHMLAFERKGLLFVFNFHPTNQYYDYPIKVSKPVDYETILTSDDSKYGGYNRVSFAKHSSFSETNEPTIKIAIPPRTCIVFKPVISRKKAK